MRLANNMGTSNANKAPEAPESTLSAALAANLGRSVCAVVTATLGYEIR